MPDREILDKLLTSLVSTLNKASLYHSNHPLFAKTAEDFKQSLQSAFNVSEPFIIGVTLNSLIIENETFVSAPCQELAKKLHLRRVKKIEIRRGITSKELLLFFNKLAMPIEEIFKAGGLGNILDKDTTPHLVIHKLDYSELLTKDAGEYKDIWPFLLREAVTAGDDNKIIKLADDFGKMISGLAINDILGDERITGNVKNFLEHLKNREDKEKFFNCAKEIAQHILQSKELPEEELKKIRVLFGCFSENDFAAILTEEILNFEGLWGQNLKLFSDVIGEDKIRSVCLLTVKQIDENFIGNKQKLKNRIEEMLDGFPDPVLCPIYRSVFSPFLEGISQAVDITFDRDSMNSNYRLIVLHLFLCVTDKDNLSVILDEALLEVQKISQVSDFGYLNILIRILSRKEIILKCEGLPQFQEINKLITIIIENSCWDASLDGFREVMDYPRTSVLGEKFYLDRFFSEKQVRNTALKLFLTLFPQDRKLFYEYISKAHSDIELMERIIAALKNLDNNLALPVLEQVYLLSNSYIKVEIIRAMRELGNQRKEFLIDILFKDELPLKQEVLPILLKDENTKKEIFKAFFTIDNPWELDSKALLINIKLMEELAIKDAKDYLSALNKKLFFWHWHIKKEIKNIMKKWK